MQGVVVSPVTGVPVKGVAGVVMIGPAVPVPVVPPVTGVTGVVFGPNVPVAVVPPVTGVIGVVTGPGVPVPVTGVTGGVTDPGVPVPVGAVAGVTGVVPVAGVPVVDGFSQQAPVVPAGQTEITTDAKLSVFSKPSFTNSGEKNIFYAPSNKYIYIYLTKTSIISIANFQLENDIHVQYLKEYHMHNTHLNRQH